MTPTDILWCLSISYVTFYVPHTRNRWLKPGILAALMLGCMMHSSRALVGLSWLVEEKPFIAMAMFCLMVSVCLFAFDAMHHPTSKQTDIQN